MSEVVSAYSPFHSAALVVTVEPTSDEAVCKSVELKSEAFEGTFFGFRCPMSRLKESHTPRPRFVILEGRDPTFSVDGNTFHSAVIPLEDLCFCVVTIPDESQEVVAVLENGIDARSMSVYNYDVIIDDKLVRVREGKLAIMPDIPAFGQILMRTRGEFLSMTGPPPCLASAMQLSDGSDELWKGRFSRVCEKTGAVIWTTSFSASSACSTRALVTLAATHAKMGQKVVLRSPLEFAAASTSDAHVSSCVRHGWTTQCLL